MQNRKSSGGTAVTTISERTGHVAAATPTRTLQMLPWAALAVDVTVLGIAGLLAQWGRSAAEFLPTPYQAPDSLGVTGFFILAGWVGLIALYKGYDRAAFGSGPDEYKRVVRASLMTAGLTGVSFYLLKYPFTRGFFLIAFAVGIPLLLVGRYALRRALHAARRRGHLSLRVLIAGSPAHVDEVAGMLTRHPHLGYSVVGAIVPLEAVQTEETPGGVPILGPATEPTPAAVACRADSIFFACGSLSCGEQLKQTMWALEEHGVHVAIAPSMKDVSAERIAMRPVGDLPMIHIEQPTWAAASRWGKRAFDLVGSALLILAFSPALAFVALRVRLYDGGPVLFKHHRIGRNGERFECLKFRTMVLDAEAQVEALQAATEQSALLFKMKDDPRITRPGRWMRRFSVDELPQLFNVLRGDMSLVGPRPQVQREVDLYEHGMERRLLVRPGMTGLWQVSGRNDLTAEEARRLDLFYVDNWSMLQDLTILCRTFTAVFGSKGAY